MKMTTKKPILGTDIAKNGVSHLSEPTLGVRYDLTRATDCPKFVPTRRQENLHALPISYCAICTPYYSDQ